jgi:hypothetical protein
MEMADGKSMKGGKREIEKVINESASVVTRELFSVCRLDV